MDLIFNYFPNLTENQKSRFLSLQPLYAEWNGRINVISRQDLDKLEERHILHAISLNKMVTFNPGARILDLGTGGGFPGIPLSILYPEVEFVLADSIGKKIGVVQAIAETLHLNNVTAVR
jgi:16S rRNA (guanine527-N7)-methyltransferase